MKLPMVSVAAVLAAAWVGAASPSGIVVGIDAQVSPAADREALVTALRGRIADPGTEVVEGCDKVTFCVTVVGAPVRIGRRDGGRAMASYVSRRLVVHPNWPWEPPPEEDQDSAASPVTIVDSYTAGGDVSCVDCERELEALKLEVDTVTQITDETLVDEGDLQLHVGPATQGFLVEVAEDIAKGLIERHVEPWRESQKKN